MVSKKRTLNGTMYGEFKKENGLICFMTAESRGLLSFIKVKLHVAFEKRDNWIISLKKSKGKIIICAHKSLCHFQ